MAEHQTSGIQCIERPLTADSDNFVLSNLAKDVSYRVLFLVAILSRNDVMVCLEAKSGTVVAVSCEHGLYRATEV